MVSQIASHIIFASRNSYLVAHVGRVEELPQKQPTQKCVSTSKMSIVIILLTLSTVWVSNNVNVGDAQSIRTRVNWSERRNSIFGSEIIYDDEFLDSENIYGMERSDEIKKVENTRTWLRNKETKKLTDHDYVAKGEIIFILGIDKKYNYKYRVAGAYLD